MREKLSREPASAGGVDAAVAAAVLQDLLREDGEHLEDGDAPVLAALQLVQAGEELFDGLSVLPGPQDEGRHREAYLGQQLGWA